MKVKSDAELIAVASGAHPLNCEAVAEQEVVAASALALSLCPGAWTPRP